jgi:hypothetical protein
MVILLILGMMGLCFLAGLGIMTWGMGKGLP